MNDDDRHVPPETDLPTWDEMSDLDKGAALLHVWERHWEGAGYAGDNYPCQYIEAPALVALSSKDACRHAVDVYRAVSDRVDDAEFDRLYHLALTEGREILDSRKLWGARHDDNDGKVSACDTEEIARFLVFDPSWRCVELLRRDQPDGDWVVVFDARGLAQESELTWVREGDTVLWDGAWRAVASVATVLRRVEQDWASVKVVGFVDGSHLEVPPYWAVIRDRQRWTVPIRRRSAVPAGRCSHAG